MKLFKKTLFLLLSVLTLVGCGTKKPENPDETPSEQPEELYINILSEDIQVYAKETFQIEFETNITGELYWESLDEDVLLVDQNGLLTGRKWGNTSVLVCYEDIMIEIEVKVRNRPVVTPKYNVTIYDQLVHEEKEGVPLDYILSNIYGKSLHKSFDDLLFEDYYLDPEFNTKADLTAKLYADITLYPKYVKDNTICDYMFTIDETYFHKSEVADDTKIKVFTPDFGSTVAYEDFTYEDDLLVQVVYDYNTNSHYIQNLYLDGDKSAVKIPYNGFVISIPKDNENFNIYQEKLEIASSIDFNRYSIIKASKIYINKTYTPENVDSISVDVNAKYVSVYDVTNKTFLYQKESSTKAYPASTTKIITALAALQYAELDDVFTIGDELDIMNEGDSPSTAGLKKGQEWTLRQLLYAMLLPSGNDASYAIACGVARQLPGNENKTARELCDIFNDMMNDVKDQVGATNSHFMVPDGNSYYNYPGGVKEWDDRISDHYVTADDMIKFALLAFNYGAIATVTSTESTAFSIISGERMSYTNTNSLIKPTNSYYYPYVVGLKTGTTNPAGACLISGAEKNGRFVIAAVMNNAVSSNRYKDSLTIYKAIFE